MTIADEKPEVERTSREAKTSDSLKEKDVEDPMVGYLPRSDEEYNVTMKTWCVVLVCELSPDDISTILTPSLDSVTLLWYQLLDCTISQRVWRCRCNSIRRS